MLSLSKHGEGFFSSLLGTVRRLHIGLLALAVLLSSHASGAEDEPSATPIAVVVGRESFLKEITKDVLREVYLRRQRLWPNGTRAIPVNLPPSNPLREKFSRSVLGRSTQDLVAYWNDRYFEGITPPAVLPSPAAVLVYLAVEPAAIGYLALSDVDDTCRVLLVLGRTARQPPAD